MHCTETFKNHEVYRYICNCAQRYLRSGVEKDQNVKFCSSVRSDYNHFSPPSIGHCWKCLRTFSVRVFWSKEIWSSEKDCSKLALAIHNGHFGNPVLDTYFEHFWDFGRKSEICLLGWLLGDPWRQVTWVCDFRVFLMIFVRDIQCFAPLHKVNLVVIVEVVDRRRGPLGTHQCFCAQRYLRSGVQKDQNVKFWCSC